MGVYLDYAAATPVDTSVLAAMQPFFVENFYNPSALYGPAVRASQALEAARADVALQLGAKPPEIIFTAGGTEANNIAIHGVMAHGGHMVYSAIEHDSVRAPAGQYGSTEIPVNKDGIVDPSLIAQYVTDETTLVSIMYANNEVGTVQPIKRIAAAIEEIRQNRRNRRVETPLYFHVDAAQAGNYLDLHVHRLGIDLMTVNGGKLYGPKQSGVLYVKTGISLVSLMQGGGQERNLRSGTENIASAVGFAAALTRSAKLRNAESARLEELRELFMEELLLAFPDATINGSRKYRLPNNVHVTLPKTDNERILMALDMEDVYAAAGSACSASHDEPSHVLAAMGLHEAAIRSSLRFSLGRQTTAEDILRTVYVLREIINK